MNEIRYNVVVQAIEEIKRGRIIIMIDDERRENEGDFVQAADAVSPESINFMITHGRGLVCQAITSKRAHELQLDWQVLNNSSLHTTRFTVSVDSREGTTTGISAQDRALTVKSLVDDATKPEDLARPGHVFPIVGEDDGLLARDGHTEGSIAVTELAERKPSAIICEILNKEGSAAKLEELTILAKKYNLVLLPIKDLIAYIKEGLTG